MESGNSKPSALSHEINEIDEELLRSILDEESGEENEDDIGLSYVVEYLDESESTSEDEGMTTSRERENIVSEMKGPNTSNDSKGSRRQVSATEWRERNDFRIPFIKKQGAALDSFDANIHPLELLDKFFPKSLLDMISNSTNAHYLAKNGNELKTTTLEIQRFLGISILASTLKFPSLNFLWRQGFRLPLVAESMPRNRFFLLRNYIRSTDGNTLSAEEKKVDILWRVRPILENFREGCMTLEKGMELSIDEMMIPFQGRLPARQYLPTKPNPLGMKVFILARPNGVVLDFRVYTGQDTFTDLPSSVKDMGVGAAAVICLSQNLEPGTSLYFDRFFTSEKLLDYLLQRGLAGTGTIMRSRIPRCIPFKSDSVMKSEGKGFSQIYQRNDKKMAFVKWYDSKPVYMISTIHARNPQDVVLRYDKRQKAHMEVNRPIIVAEYNKNMGGVDMVDRMVSRYRMGSRTNKWSVRVLQQFLDCALSNAWILYQENSKRNHVQSKDVMDFLEFRLWVSECWIKNVSMGGRDSRDSENKDPSNQPHNSSNRRSVVRNPPPEVRQTEAKHLPEFVESPQSNRCRFPGCKSHSRIKCSSCNVFLCVQGRRNCFLKYHS